MDIYNEFMCIFSHLPSYLVAAFAKKLARLSLTAPPHGLVVVIPMVYNLLMRHPTAKVLLHNPEGPTGKEHFLYSILCCQGLSWL